jgi:hypothetical protein
MNKIKDRKQGIRLILEGANSGIQKDYKKKKKKPSKAVE